MRQKKFYYINGKIFNEASSKRSYIYARHYAVDKGLDESQIYELANMSELAYLEELLQREDVREIRSHPVVCTLNSFENANGETIPELKISCSFAYLDNERTHYVAVVNSVYELTKAFVLQKIIIDYFGIRLGGEYLEVYYLDNEGLWKEWHIKENAPFIEKQKEMHKQYLAKKRAIRDRQKYDRLLRLREQGKISERQSQELYRLEKVFRG